MAEHMPCETYLCELLVQVLHVQLHVTDDSCVLPAMRPRVPWKHVYLPRTERLEKWDNLLPERFFHGFLQQSHTLMHCAMPGLQLGLQ